MPLTLKIISKQKHILGADSVRVFTVHGGSIGRAPDNDWVLPDPDRFISGHHASIDYRDGGYFLRDTSTNGVFVNRSEQPVGRGTPIRLYDGDELRMGDYMFRASIIEVSQDDEPRGPRLRRKEEDPANLALKLLSEHAEESEDPAEKLERELSGQSSGGDDMLSTVRVTDAEIESQAEIDRRKIAEIKQTESARLTVEDALRLDSAPGGEPARPAPSGASQRNFTEAVRLLLEHAGLDAANVPREDEEEIVATAGRMLRAAADGLRMLLQQRARTKSQYRISLTGFEETANNPLKLAPTTQEALEQMFYRREDVDAEAYLGPLEAVDNAVRDLNIHQAATMKAVQVAVRDLLDRLDPEGLEERFKQGAKPGGLLGSSPKSRYWDLYRDAYRSIAGFSDESFAAVIGARFADAYDREIQAAASREERDRKKHRS
ncbi:MAG: type VI secretion system-associated FHA domain protein TagH [Gammaproteobacteria bacterium]|jgi:type VI secretion system FHA domain protein